MAYTIEQFMWGYQEHYRIAFQLSAERILNAIDPALQPRVLLIGVLIDQREDRHSVCIEPEDCGYSQSMFDDVTKLAVELMKTDSETNIHQTHPIAQKYQDERIVRNSFKEAIKKILDRETTFSDQANFVSYPNYKDGYLVFPVIQVNKTAYNKHYRLNVNKWNDRYELKVSLLQSTIEGVLDLAMEGLYVPDAGAGPSFTSSDNDEVMKKAGASFMYTISSKGNNFDGLHGLFDACNVISSLRYENKPISGSILVAPLNHENIRMTLKLDDPIKITEHRKVRKFLELTSDSRHAICDSALIYGLGELRGHYNPILENLFKIRFTNHYHWELYHSDNILMKVAYNIPSVPRLRLNREKFYSDFKRIFPASKPKNADAIFAIIEKAIDQKHGTMLVVSDGASQEADRLRNQSFKIEETSVDASFVEKISGIDGAILLDHTGTCFSIGVILDGIAVSKGDSARGARYNSAVRYFESVKNKFKTLILIVSEDGMIDFIPDLMPQVRRSALIKLIDHLEEIHKSKEIFVKEFNRLCDDIYAHKFYFSKEQCDKLNTNRQQIESRLREEKEQYFQIVRSDLEPNPEMDDSYFKDEEGQ